MMTVCLWTRSQLKLELLSPPFIRLKAKAISRGWKPGKVVEPEHVDGVPRPGRPKTSTVIAELIVKIVTKNSTTRGWSCSKIAF
jgi:hypothetical protein